MNFVRKVIDSDSLESLISLPDELKHKKVEVLILPIEEKNREDDFNPKEYRGVLNLDSEELETELNKMRDNWERL